jgi:phosphoribosylglycinamide formyltransferase 1
MGQLRKLRLAVLVSGRGSNLQSLIDAAAADAAFPGEIVAVLSNRPDAYALTRAATAGIPAILVDHKSFADRESFEAAMDAALRRAAPDLICLAGFMRILSPSFVSRWHGRILNIHPSLLPRHKGLDTHRRVLEAGDTETGCTVHVVTADLDDGPIVVQRSIPVLPGENEDDLSARVLAEEHRAYPEAIRHMARVLKSGDAPIMIPPERTHAMQPSSEPSILEPAQIARAETGWEAFVKYGKWFTLCVIGLLVLLSFILL